MDDSMFNKILEDPESSCSFFKELNKSINTLPLTEVTVDLVEKTLVNKKRLGKLDVNYASFLLNQACSSPTSVIIAMIYLDRIKKLDQDFVSKNTSSELFLASLIVATKFLFDKGADDMIYNDEWATFANLDLEDLNQLERDFLQAIKWSCYVDSKTFLEQVIKLEGLISMNKYMKRKNSMTYLEMISWFKYLKQFHKDKNNELIWGNLSNIIQSILICSAAYFIAIGIVMVSSTLVFTLHNHIGQNTNITIDYNYNNNNLSNFTFKAAQLKNTNNIFNNQFMERFATNPKPILETREAMIKFKRALISKMFIKPNDSNIHIILVPKNRR